MTIPNIPPPTFATKNGGKICPKTAEKCQRSCVNTCRMDDGLFIPQQKNMTEDNSLFDSTGWNDPYLQPSSDGFIDTTSNSVSEDDTSLTVTFVGHKKWFT